MITFNLKDIDPDNLEIYMAVSEKIRKKEEEIV